MLLRLATLSLLILYPIAWSAPLMRAGILPLFGLSEISVITGLISLWDSDIFLALVVALFALVAPMAKLLALLLIQLGRAKHHLLLHGLGKLAMADIFLIALYITLAKGIGLVTVETAWGLYLFTFCILASFVLSLMTNKGGSAPSG